jgi:hypothetical protein
MAGAELILTDMEQNVARAQHNILLNKTHIGDATSVVAQELLWGDDVSALGKQSVPFDWIVAIDCVYPKSPHWLLVESLRALTDSHSKVLFCYEHRLDQTRADFFGNAGRYFDFEQLAPIDFPRRYYASDIEVYILTKKVQQQQ